jgi:hypothetical protein
MPPGESAMNLIDQYLRRSREIIGDRTEAEERYDDEVVAWLRKGAGIRKAIHEANNKYPDEALEIDEANVDDVAAHYEYLVQHAEITQKIDPTQDKE